MAGTTPTSPTVPSKKTAAKKKPSQKKKSVGRPKKNFFLRTGRKFKTATTGETRNSPTTDPNIIFWLGVSLIIFSGWSSGRIKSIFTFAWHGVAIDSRGKLSFGEDAGQWATDLIHFGSQFIFLFIMVITARAIPPLARIWLVIIGGMWILYLMKNPQVLMLLNASSATPNRMATESSNINLANLREAQGQYQAIIDKLKGTFPFGNIGPTILAEQGKTSGGSLPGGLH